ncbi:hypothetical protein [Aeromicrobium massiliense]|uniref:hypothetical protein n=1 Tax=Aeromicrobium massiliense TaxID=1464554 RepID=UPI0006769E8D|nr:hypothetical protein [Aeromicrobium massiliense]
MNENLSRDAVAPAPEHDPSDAVVVDCGTCLVRSAAACGDCVVTVLLGAPPEGVVIDADERAAFDALAASGLVPPLRLVVPLDDGHQSGQVG